MQSKSKVVEALLSVAIRKSLGFKPKEAEKWSIVPCAGNEYLQPDYDPFKMLEFTLMAYTLREKHNLKEV